MRSRGFTLLELVAVVIVIGVVGAIAAPRLSGSIALHRLDGAAQRITADLERARELARASSASVTITFDALQDRYTVASGSPLADAGATRVVELTRPPYHCRLIGIDAGGNNVLVFDGYGVPDSTAAIIVANSFGQRVIEVDRAGAAAVRP